MVEDEASLRALIVRLLRLNGFAVLEAGDGVEAHQKATEHAEPIDLLITDLILPRMVNGFRLARELQADHNDMHVLIISGCVPEFDTWQLSRGSIPFLQKPFRLEALLDKVRALLGTENFEPILS